jgi:hypothetical protein
VLYIIVITIIKNLFRQNVLTLDEIRTNSSWRTILAHSDDPFALCYKAPLSIPRDKRGFEHLLMLSWSYDVPGSRRLPTEVENQVISFCTSHLRQTLDNHKNLINLLSMSSDGLHQWVVATNDLAIGFAAAVDAFPNHKEFVAELGLPPVVIRVERLTDPTWLPVRQARDIAKRFPSTADRSTNESSSE